MKNKALGILVRMVKIIQVGGSYEIKRCNKLSLGGSSRGSMKKKAICKRMNNKWRERKMCMYWVN